MTRSAWLPALSLLALLLVACGPDGTGATASSTSEGAVPTNATAAGAGGTTGSTSCPFTGTTSATKDTSNQAKATLAKVTPSQTGCIDTLAFGFATFPPSWSVAYANGPFTDASSGSPVSVPGPSTLVVTFSATTYEGGKVPSKVSPSNLSHVTDITVAGGPDGSLQWIISVDQQLQYQTSVSNAPSNFTLSIA